MTQSGSQPVSPITAMRPVLACGSGSTASPIAARAASAGTVASHVKTGNVGGSGKARTCIVTVRPSTSSAGQVVSVVMTRAMRSPPGPSSSHA